MTGHTPPITLLVSFLILCPRLCLWVLQPSVFLWVVCLSLLVSALNRNLLLSVQCSDRHLPLTNSCIRWLVFYFSARSAVILPLNSVFQHIVLWNTLKHVWAFSFQVGVNGAGALGYIAILSVACIGQTPCITITLELKQSPTWLLWSIFCKMHFHQS